VTSLEAHAPGSEGALVKIDAVRERESAHFLPVVKRLPVALVEGRGSRVRDIEGREYTDLTAGWGVACLGHCHPTLVAAIAEQAGRLMQTTNWFYTLPQLDLIERLAERMPPAITRSFIVNSGTEAVEGALKLAHRATGRAKFVSTTNSFHGRTLGALSVIGQPKHREPYRALLPEPVCVPFGDVRAAELALDRDCAAFIVEPIQGEGGVNVPPPGYLGALRRLTEAAGALLVFDEVQTGVGRTGRMFALEHEGVVPDVVTLGKGLGGGFPVAAFLTSEAVAATVSLGDHGTTFGGNPLACAAANAVLHVIEAEKLVERAASLGERLLARLRDFAREHPEVAQEARGRGLLLGLELHDAERAAALPLRAVQRGVLVNVTAGRVVRLFPALNIPEEELWPAVETVLELARG
jgi:predicted acetylornithine/succinylornithine family transaminase